MYRRFITFANDLLLILSIFCLSFIWLQYLRRDLTFSIVLAAAITTGVYMIIRYVLQKRSDRNSLNSADQTKIKDVSAQFMFASTKQTLDFFAHILADRFEIKQKAAMLELKKDESCTLFIPLYQTFIITERDILPFLKKEKRDIMVCGKKFSGEAKELSALYTKKLKLLDEEQVYNELLKPVNTYPAFSNINKQKKKLHLREVVFSKNKTKPYFFSGLVLLLTSFFVRFHIYYVIVSSILFLTAIFCSFNKKYNPPAHSVFE